jgi:hypothetical protein
MNALLAREHLVPNISFQNSQNISSLRHSSLPLRTAIKGADILTSHIELKNDGMQV